MLRDLWNRYKLNLKNDRLDDTIWLYFNLLLDKALSIFEYEVNGDDDGNLTMFCQEFERRLILSGSCGVIPCPHDDALPLAVYAYGCVPTYYYDQYERFNWSSPLGAGEKIIVRNAPIFSNLPKAKRNDGDGIMVYNDSTHDGLYRLIYHYAELLTHLSLSIRSVSINMREPSAIPTVSTNRLAYLINNFKRKILNGDFKPMVDLGLSTVKWVDNKGVPSNTLSELYEVRKKILLEFYNSIGVKTGYEKKGNVISEELDSNDEMLRINVDDMLKHRQQAMKEIEKRFGILITVKLKGGGGNVSDGTSMQES